MVCWHKLFVALNNLKHRIWIAHFHKTDIERYTSFVCICKLLSVYISIEDRSVILCLSYLSIEKDIIVTIRTWDANSDIIVARSQPMSPNGHGYDFHIIVNSKGITKR